MGQTSLFGSRPGTTEQWTRMCKPGVVRMNNGPPEGSRRQLAEVAQAKTVIPQKKPFTALPRQTASQALVRCLGPAPDVSPGARGWKNKSSIRSKSKEIS